MSYRYKVRLAGKTDKKEKSIISEALERLTTKFRASFHRAILKDLFVEYDPFLIDKIPDVRLQRSIRQQTIFDRISERISEPMEFGFFEKERLFTFPSLRRSFAATLVFAVTFAGFLGFSSKNLVAAVEQPHSNQQKQAVKGSLEFLPTDCPPIMQLSNCVNASINKMERSIDMRLISQSYPGTSLTHSNSYNHSNSGGENETQGSHTNTMPSSTHTNSSHVNLAPGDTIF